ncbi:hypothetical protein ACKWTF_003843 [Chironomus riparius]
MVNFSKRNLKTLGSLFNIICGASGIWLLIIGGKILVFEDEDNVNEFVVLYAFFIITAGFVLLVASIINLPISFMKEHHHI